jgi:hypothetical protein
MHRPTYAAESGAGVTQTNSAFLPLTPEHYGAVGDGVTDDTAALTRWVSAVNASTAPVSRWPYGKTYLCAPLPTITAANFTWLCHSTILTKVNTQSTVPQVAVSGANLQLAGLAINGNQSVFSTPQSYGLTLTGNNPTLRDVSVVNCSGDGLIMDKVVGGSLTNVHVDNNAFTGAIFNNISNVNFTNVSFDFNGYGLNKTFATNTFAAFGMVIRFRSHHVNFTGCRARQNGRDGFNNNQGAYALKYIGCLAWMNDDTGIALDADNTGTGRPGEGEGCYDIEFIDCEAYNNWTSGITGSSTAYNITVSGGRYYNNGRLAGSLASVPAFASGIYFAQGSAGINVRTKCYDDRQLCAITANSGGVLSATNWGATSHWGSQPAKPPLSQANFTPTAANYPAVALYNASLVFQGYALITAESAGSVTVAAVAHNSVTVASIASGWFISQRVQHNGCYFEIGCTGVADIDGFGFLPGINAAYGFKTYSNPGRGGQNVLNLCEAPNGLELLNNPSWDSGTGSGTTWRYFGTGVTVTAITRTGTNNHSGGAVRIAAGSTAGGANCSALVNGYFQDCWFEASVLCTATNAGDASLTVLWANNTLQTTVKHPGGGTTQLKIGGYLPSGNAANTAAFLFQIGVAIGKTAVFDEGSVKVKFDHSDNRDFTYPTRNLAV